MSPQKAGDILRLQMPLWQQKGMRGQIAFFGGTFTGLPKEEMLAYLAVAAPYIKNGAVNGIRISTRPDAIDDEILTLLAEHGVTHIELGVQSMDDEVLRRSGRGYTASEVVKSATRIRDRGFVLGMQLMPGLPGDTPEKSLYSARQVIALGAEETRLYPTVVIRGTPLATLWEKGEYHPLTTEDAVTLCARLKSEFEHSGVRVLKVGLHSGAVEQDVLAGPFHPAFGQLVDSRICLDQMAWFCRKNNLQNTELFVVPQRYDTSVILGQRRSNVTTMMENFGISLKISKKVLTNGKNSIIL